MNDRKNDDFHNLRFMLLINNTVIHIHSVEEVQREREKKPLKGFKLQITVRYRDKINLANNSKDHIHITKRSLKKTDSTGLRNSIHEIGNRCKFPRLHPTEKQSIGAAIKKSPFLDVQKNLKKVTS